MWILRDFLSRQQRQPQFLEKLVVLFCCRFHLLMKREQICLNSFQINVFFNLQRADITGDVEIEIVRLDLGHGDSFRVTGFFGSVLICPENLVNIFRSQPVLALAFFVVFCSIDEQDVIRLLAFLQYQDAHRDPGGVKEVGGKSNDGVDVAILQQPGANTRFGPSPEQHPMREDDGHDPIGLQVVKPVKHEGKVSG